MSKRTSSRSPEGVPPSFAKLPPALSAAFEARNHARSKSLELREAHNELAKQAEPKGKPEEQTGPGREASYKLAQMGIELANQEQHEVRLDNEVVKLKQASGALSAEEAEKKLRQLNRRYVSIGDELWRNHKKKMRLEESSQIPLVDIRGDGLAQGILSLYRKSDPVKAKPKKRQSSWREDALTYYAGRSRDHPQVAQEEMVWCHVSGMWWLKGFVKAAHIVPFFLDMENVGELLFGSQVESLDRAGNALLLSNQVKSWFDSYHLVIVPVDPTEMPIKRWRTDIISPDIKNAHYFSIMSPDKTNGQSSGEWPSSDLDGKELVFLNHRRPVSRFMYFHFVMALVRIKDVNRPGWQDSWARYYQQRPFPTPGPYMRGRMLLALATHFGTADLRVVDSWIKDNGFDTPLQLLDEEATEAARRVHAAVEEANRLSELRIETGDVSSDEDGSDGDSPDEDGSDYDGEEGKDT